MSGKKEEIHFNEYFMALWEDAQSWCFNKGTWMIQSGIGRQRFAEFMRSWENNVGGVTSGKQARNLTTPYFLKLLGPLQLTPQEVEIMAGCRFTEDQLTKLQYDAFMRAHEEMFMELMKDPAKLELCKSICKLQSKLQMV